MAMKTHCDRCKKPCGDKFSRVVINSMKSPVLREKSETIDMCGNCSLQLRKLLNDSQIELVPTEKK